MLISSVIPRRGFKLIPLIRLHRLTGQSETKYLFENPTKGTKYWRNRLLKVASQLDQVTGKSPFKYQFAIGARKEFENTIFEELGGNDSWGEKGIGLFLTFFII